MDLQLKVTLLLGRLSGCFPVQDLRNLEYSLKHPIFFFSFLILALYTGFEVWSFYSQRNVMALLQPSKIIVMYLVSVNNTISCVTTRIWLLYRCSRVSEIILNLTGLMKLAAYKKGSYIFRYYAFGYIILSIDLIPFCVYVFNYAFGATPGIPLTAVYHSYLPTGIAIPPWLEVLINISRQLIQIQTRYFALAIIVYMGVNLLHIYENFCSDLQSVYCPEAVANVHIIDDEDDLDFEEEGTTSDGNVSTDNIVDGKIASSTITKDVAEFAKKFPTIFGFENYFGARIHNNGNVNGDGSQHQTETTGELYNSDVEIVNSGDKAKMKIATVFSQWPPGKGTKNLWASNTIQTSDSLKGLSEKFLEIQKYFDDYNKVAGPSFFILVFFATIGLIHKLYAVASSEFSINHKMDETIRYACKSTVAFLLIAGLSHLGEVIASRMKKWKEQLKCVMLTELLCEKDHDSTNTLTESVVKWDWQLTAMNLFNINHALLPAIAGTMVTYLIVIIQLKVSEGPVGKNVTTYVEPPLE